MHKLLAQSTYPPDYFGKLAITSFVSKKSSAMVILTDKSAPEPNNKFHIVVAKIGGKLRLIADSFFCPSCKLRHTSSAGQ